MCLCVTKTRTGPVTEAPGHAWWMVKHSANFLQNAR